MQKTAIVTDGLHRKSLAAVRSLGKAGYNVIVLGDSLFTTSFWSRYTNQWVLAPLASTHPNAFLSRLSTLCGQFEKPVLFLMEESSQLAFAQVRDQFKEKAHFLLAETPSLEEASNKLKTRTLALQCGIPVPDLWEASNAQALFELIPQIASNRGIDNLLIKPKKGSGSQGIVFAPQLSLSQIEALWMKHGEYFLMERLPAHGKGIGVSLLMDEWGECVADFTHERIQEFPLTGGPSTNRKSIHHPKALEWSITLLKKLGWRGVAMVEWKEDLQTGKLKLLEINPRFWGSLELAIRSGVDFPALYAQLCQGERASSDQSFSTQGYREGIRCRWLIPGDLLRFLKDPHREGLKEFFKNIREESEEWDPSDQRGFWASWICNLALFFRPKYWHLLFR